MLLSTASLPFSKSKAIRFGGAAYMVSISGPGEVTTHEQRQGGVGIKLFATTQDSQVSISALNARSHAAVKPLDVGRIEVRSGRVGSILGLTSAHLDGPISPRQGPVNSLRFTSIGPAAQIDVDGNLGQSSVNRGIDLGPSGPRAVTNDMTGHFSVRSDVSLLGGKIQIGRDLAGAVRVGGTLTVNDGGAFTGGRNLGGSSAPATTTGPTTGTAAGGTAGTLSPSGGGGATIAGDLILDPSGVVTIGGDAGSPTVGGNVSSAGRFAVSGDWTGLTVNGAGATGNVTLYPGGVVSLGQNLGTLAVGGNLVIDQQAEVRVGGNLTTRAVGGDLDTAPGGRSR